MKGSSWLLLLLVFLLPACEDTGEGPLDLKGSPPFLQSLQVDPHSINIDTILAVAGRYPITYVVTVLASDPDGLADIARVSYSLMSGQTVIDSGALPLMSAAIPPPLSYAMIGRTSITRDQTGIFVLQVQGIDKAGLKGNILTKQFVVVKANTPPQLSAVALRGFALGDSARVVTSIAVLDSNGLTTVASVTVRPLNTTDSTTRQLYDDGLSSHADKVAGDGVFSNQFTVKPLTTIENIVCEYRAVDASGAQSIPVQRAVANRAPRITALDAPSDITRPVTGVTHVPFYVTVTDPDGLADIDSVYLRNTSSSSPTNFLMYDDGDAAIHGDITQGDGVYSQIFSIDVSTTTGAKSFLFRVRDRAGAVADTIKVITIH
jgi:hypothetical protein